jgi:pentose-5-phosphate-3-epimerase
VVASWHNQYSPYTVGGSIYAVPRPYRLAAARALVASHCRVHADVILDERGTHQGVTLSELSELRQAEPSAQVDVHLITLGSTDRSRVQAEEERVLAAVTGKGVVAITLAPDQIARYPDLLSQLRAAGSQVWVEFSPARSGAPLPVGILVDGALVMFIQPGTQDIADLNHLSKVKELSYQLPVAVDGGITDTIASRCRDHGASYLISGRALLSVTPEPTRSTNATPSEEGAQP